MELLADNPETEGLPAVLLTAQSRLTADRLRTSPIGKKYRTAASAYRPNPLICSRDPAGSAPVGLIGQLGSPESDSKPTD